MVAARDWASDLGALGRIAFDTNALIYLLEGQQPQGGLVAEALWRIERGAAIGVVSTVVEMELLVRPFREQRLDVVERVDFLLRNVRTIVVRPMDRAVARLAADLRSRTRLQTPDAIIGAMLSHMLQQPVKWCSRSRRGPFCDQTLTWSACPLVSIVLSSGTAMGFSSGVG